MPLMKDLFQSGSAARAEAYSAKDIEVLEGLEPVRHRPGMYIGGTDERGLHHLVAEVLDNAMDEAVAGHASRIDVELAADGYCTVRDNGRGIPVDKHPKYPGKSALEIILTMLHSGGKFSQKAYETAGGLHGVGVSVVNALSDDLQVEVARDRRLYTQSYSRGVPNGKLKDAGPVLNRRGTTLRFHPDPQIFGKGAKFRPSTAYRMCRSKAYLFKGVEIRWKCDAGLLQPGDLTPAEATLHFPGGLADFLASSVEDRGTVTPSPFVGEVKLAENQGRVEWAITWPLDDEGFVHSYCNTIPTPEGGTHEQGFRQALLRGVRGYAELVNNKRIATVQSEDVVGGAAALLSVFVKDPQFQGQTKEKLVSQNATKLVEQAVKDRFDHWLSGHPEAANALLARIIERQDDRLRKRQEKETKRQSATRKLRLPGKLTDCSRTDARGTEIFLVEGDSAGGSAKQARERETQAVLPLRGKILNVASASAEKLRGNQELSDLTQALGVQPGTRYDDSQLRYERVIIMTDADVDGAHIASLLMTYFYREMPELIRKGHLFLAQPPLYRLQHGATSVYARDDADKDRLLKSHFKPNTKVEISRFKGLGEMPPAQLRETTMSPKTRTLLRVEIAEDAAVGTADMVERLMGRKPELRFQFIQENAKTARDLDV
ncbi:MAG: DNA topoisomerase IV subunit B [Alphaproteobacteria bacterium]|nr:DNA topoisomerase IV subunit B [Alphaproteobacteria bacterium]